MFERRCTCNARRVWEEKDYSSFGKCCGKLCGEGSLGDRQGSAGGVPRSGVLPFCRSIVMLLFPIADR